MTALVSFGSVLEDMENLTLYQQNDRSENNPAPNTVLLGPCEDQDDIEPEGGVVWNTGATGLSDAYHAESQCVAGRK